MYSYQDLENGLRGLAKELPASHQEIAATAEAAGQLGIQTDNVVSFTKTMIDMGESTNMSAETAATSLARFANITGLSQDKFDRLGSVIVDLGNNFATTEAEITAMGLRLAGAGSQVGMTEAEIMSFAAALSSVGIEAEAGGSAFSKVMVQMQLAAENGSGAFDELEAMANNAGYSLKDVVVAVQDGGKNLNSFAAELGTSGKNLKAMYKEADKSATSLENFAKVAGLTNAEFAEMFKNDPSQAIMKFVEGLATAEERGTSAIKVLEDMDIKEVRLRDSLLRAAGASDTFGDAIDRGSKAWEENSALTEEAAKRYETTESKLKMLKNEAVDAAIELGGPFVDALRSGLEAGKPTIEMLGNLAKAFNEADPEKQRFIMGLIAATAAAGPLMSITGKLAGSVGKVGKAFIELSAASAKKKAIKSMTTVLAEGALSSDDLVRALAGGTSALPKFGSAAASAGGSKGAGALLTTLTGLGPVGWGIVGAGGLLAVGYGAWKLWGEEAYNAGQRTKRWGTDVGEATDEALTEIKGFSDSATGQFGLMAEGFSSNSEQMANNFTKIGDVIESNLIKKIEGLQQLIDELPANVDSSLKDMITEEQENAQQALEIVQSNSARIQEIRENASNHNRELSAAETKIIRDLAVDSTQAYVETLDVSASEKKKILAAMTSDVANATKEEAKLWVQSLGQQRRMAQENLQASRKEKEKYLEDLGYNLDGEFAQKFMKAWDEINQTTVDGFDQQMGTILEKYPELQNEVWLATGQLIDATSESGKQMILSNEEILENAGRLSTELAKNATKNAEMLAWQADESKDAIKSGAEIWNNTVFDEKTGEVKTNANEAVIEATKDAQTWNDIRLLVHEADLDSNAKKVIGEAAIANGWWDGMAWEDKEAVLQDEFSINMYKALDSSGKWQEMSLEEKKAILHSNTPEVMAETMLNLGLWNDYQPTIKELGAKNFQLLDALSQSEESLGAYNNLNPKLKELLGEAPVVMTAEEAVSAINDYNNLPEKLKKLLADNTDVKRKVDNAKQQIDSWNGKQIPNKTIVLKADTRGAGIAQAAINSVKGKTVFIDIVRRGGASIAGKAYAKGTNFHPGGHMMVNDQKGSLYKELVEYPTGEMFIPNGRNVIIPNAPRAAKVYTASQTRQMIPKYAEGVGVPANSTVVKNLRAVNAPQETVQPISNYVQQEKDYSGEFSTLIRIMENFSDDLKNLKVILDGRNVAKSVETRVANKEKMNKLLRGENV